MATFFVGDIHGNATALGADGRPRPRVRHNTIGLDTIEYGVLTAIRLPDRRVFQAEG